ncbi:UDP-N-acetylmuramoyl-L-alanine--D-glutamate ligase [Legionella spiritensis]|uniref:UDP-N-acetylmuramoylalanine--D-glutamate ligase n=1 Tax=Legionella spiritensis TaxID=452 RepID=A0A0W0YYX2_LEGSP|nr:UDP-N-acetylmuramoyl-L-alanine--D-glutamate ligase [Legionella spiritensis]KTD62096.1 UDP-N-acetylmuramoyl-L-alanyl-D-glutamate synthetase [Legionella spiritensis]SNV35661.1 UDP-N-acetylmuramoylalanine--D-glutamate ligase [Legionella spiritensis]
MVNHVQEKLACQADEAESGVTAIIGLDGFGASCMEFLARRGAKMSGTYNLDEIKHLISPRLYADLCQSVDKIRLSWPDIEINANFFDEKLLDKADRFVLSPGISYWSPFLNKYKDKGIPIFTELDLFRRYTSAPMVAVTGTNGKSSVTDLVSTMLGVARRNIITGGNFKTLMMDLIAPEEPEMYLLELSSFQLEAVTSLPLKTAALLNISPDHMDRYPNFSAYRRAKFNIFNHCEHAVIHRDIKIDHSVIKNGANIIRFGLQNPSHDEFGIKNHKKRDYLAYGQDCLIALDDLTQNGKHHYENILAAMAIAHTIGISVEDMRHAIKSHKSLAHSCQFITCHEQISWFNDSKAVNVAACLNAIDYVRSKVSGQLVLIAGGFSRPADFTPLQSVVKQHVKHAILFGKSAVRLREALEGVTPVTIVNTLKDAVTNANKIANAGDAVLLSPACASYDMFKNYKHRGDEFVKCVTKITQQP